MRCPPLLNRAKGKFNSCTRDDLVPLTNFFFRIWETGNQKQPFSRTFFCLGVIESLYYPYFSFRKPKINFVSRFRCHRMPLENFVSRSRRHLMSLENFVSHAQDDQMPLKKLFNPGKQTARIKYYYLLPIVRIGQTTSILKRWDVALQYPLRPFIK